MLIAQAKRVVPGVEYQIRASWDPLNSAVGTQNTSALSLSV